MEPNLEKGNTAVTEKPSIFGVITSPVVQFKRLKEKPVIGIPLLIVIILIAAGSILRGLGMNYEEVLNSSSLDGLTDDQIEMTKTFAKFGTMFGGIFGGIIALFIVPLIYWLCVKISGGVTTYKKMLSLSLFTAFITNIGLVINGLVTYFTGAGSLYAVTSLASVIPAGGGVAVFLSAFDIFSIWSYILLALGLRYTGGISKKAAWTSAIVLFVIMLLVSAVGGLLSSVTAGV
ncbi:Yip1 family protein [Bacillus velezensis]|uniref:Yip1 family protein n=1 Tax=Bacillus velezensis TaxID=492670 RepID=UPI002DB73058|nr:Yip1 family protein [Bacillus velezensis]MEC3612381.1 Yip1 family protein [Bacillus velezensis]MEC3677562.1 Yip1 family protein [Bacillus velezensis]